MQRHLNPPGLDLDSLASVVSGYAGLREKQVIGLVTEVFGASDWLSGPGDDGAAVP